MNMKLFCTGILTFILSFGSVYAQSELFKDKTPEKTISEKYMQGILEINVHNNIEKGAVLFAEILDMDSTHAPSHYMLSNILTSKVEKTKHIEKANKYDSTNKWYQNALTDAYLSNGNYPAAIKSALKTLAQNPNDHETYFDVTQIYISFKKYEDAEKSILIFEGKFGETSESLFYKIQTYELTPVSEALIEKLRKMLIENPHSQQLLTVLGGKLKESGNYEEALKYYKEAEKFGANDIKLVFSFIDFYIQGRDMDNLVKYMRKAFVDKSIGEKVKISLVNSILFTPHFYKSNSFDIGQLIGLLFATHPTDKEINYLVAQHYINMGLLDKSEEQYYSMIENNIDIKDAHLHLIGLYSYQKNYQKLIEVTNKLTELFPDMAYGNSMQIAFAEMELGQYDKATSRMKELASNTTDKIKLSEIWGFIADIYNAAGDTKMSYKSYDKSLSYNRSNIVTLNNYSYHLSVEGKQLKKALKMIKIAVRAEPENATYLDTFGWIFYQLGDYFEATEVLKKAVSVDTQKSNVILIHYGDALYKLGKEVNAKVYWMRAQKNGADQAEIDKRMNGKLE